MTEKQCGEPYRRAGETRKHIPITVLQSVFPTVCQKRRNGDKEMIRHKDNKHDLAILLVTFLGSLSGTFKGCWWPRTFGDKKVTA